MKIHLIIISAIISLGLLSCSNSSKIKIQVSRVDSLYFVAKILENQAASVNIDTITSYKLYIDKTTKFILSNSKLISEDKLLSRNIIKLGNAGRVFKKFNQNYSDLLNDIKFSKTQLKNLKEDLNNGLVKESDFVKYYEDEKKAIEDVKKEVIKLKAKLVYNIQIYYHYKPYFEETVEKILSHTNK